MVFCHAVVKSLMTLFICCEVVNAPDKGSQGPVLELHLKQNSVHDWHFIAQSMVAELDARLSGDHEVVGSPPPDRQHSWGLILKYFLWSF